MIASEKPALLALGAGICWGTSGVVMHHLGACGFTAAEIGALRLTVAAAAVSLIALRRPGGMRIHLRQLPSLAMMGAGCLFFYSLCYVLSVRELSLSLTAVLVYTSPAIVMLLSVRIFHEPLTPRKTVALGLTLGGICLAAGISPAAQHYSARGIGFGLLAALLYALYAVLAKIEARRGNPLTVTAWCFIFGAAAALCAIDIPHGLGILQTVPESLAWIAAISILNTALPYLLYTQAIGQGEASRAAMMASIEPVVATLSGMIFFHETLGLWACLGMLLTIAGLMVMNRSPRREGSLSAGSGPR